MYTGNSNLLEIRILYYFPYFVAAYQSSYFFPCILNDYNLSALF